MDFGIRFILQRANYPDPIQITKRNQKITNDACRKCHAEIVEMIEGPATKHSASDTTSCIRCHRNVGHLH
jgi:cytochrome c nitrite reductase small subunit